MQNNKKYFFLLLLLVVAIFIFSRKTSDVAVTESNEQSDKQHQGSRDVASSSANNTSGNPSQATSSLDSVDDRDNSDNTQVAQATQSDISPNDPVDLVLKKYGINPLNKVVVEYDDWFISKKYVQIHSSEFTPGQATVFEKHNNFYVVEHNSSITSDDHPPLVISHSTNQPVPITGHIIVKFLNPAQMNETIDYLQNDRDLDDLISEVVVEKNLVDIRRLLVKTKKRGHVFVLYEKLSQQIGHYNIESLIPDNNYQFKN